jgi:hypothetical protein
MHMMWGKLHIPLLCATGTSYCFVQSVLYDAVVLNISLQRLAAVEKSLNLRILSIFSVVAAEDIVITTTLCYLLRRNRGNLFSR